MRTSLVVSTRPYSGKSGLCLTLTEVLRDKGLSVGYVKTYGTLPTTMEGVLTDEDAYYINSRMEPPAPLDAVCPIVTTRDLVERYFSGRVGDPLQRVVDACERVGEGRDAVIAEGPSDATQGVSLGVTPERLAERFGCGVLVVARFDEIALPDAIMAFREQLGERLTGVIFNNVPESHLDLLDATAAPHLEAQGVPVLGAIPHDPTLGAVTVEEIVDSLGAAVLSAEDRLDGLVESFMVGAMGQEKALRFFRRRGAKAVVTGGDRADVQSAALETDTRCLVLTGDMPPSAPILSRADELGVPILLVDTDTLTAVEHMEGLFGKTRLHDERKIARMREMFEAAVDVDAAIAALGLV